MRAGQSEAHKNGTATSAVALRRFLRMSLRLWLMLREWYVVSNVAAAGAHTITTPIQPSSSTGQGFHEQRAKKKQPQHGWTRLLARFCCDRFTGYHHHPNEGATDDVPNVDHHQAKGTPPDRQTNQPAKQTNERAERDFALSTGWCTFDCRIIIFHPLCFGTHASR